MVLVYGAIDREFESRQYQCSHENWSVLEIPSDKELVKTRTKLRELILPAMVLLWAGWARVHEPWGPSPIPVTSFSSIPQSTTERIARNKHSSVL